MGFAQIQRRLGDIRRMARSSFAFRPAALGCALALLLATETAAQCLDPVPAGSQVVPYLESYANPETANTSFAQFQFDVLNGPVRMLCMGVSPNSSSPFGCSYLVGCKGLGPITAPGSTTLTTTLPASFRFGITPAMSPWATPAPSSTPTVGASVTYTKPAQSVASQFPPSRPDPRSAWTDAGQCQSAGAASATSTTAVTRVK